MSSAREANAEHSVRSSRFFVRNAFEPNFSGKCDSVGGEAGLRCSSVNQLKIHRYLKRMHGLQARH